MKTDITFNGCHRVFEHPEGVYFVGVTIVRDGHLTSVLDSDEEDEEYRLSEEIVLDDGIKIIFHYYSAPPLVDLIVDFEAFGNMKIIEIKFENFYLFQTR